MPEHHAIITYAGLVSEAPQIAVSELYEGAWQSSHSGHSLQREHPVLIGQEAVYVVESLWTLQ